MRIDIPAKASLPPRLVPTGVPCQNLVDHLVKHTSIARQAIANATRFDEKLSKKDRQKLAPKNKGLNIEGLVYYPPNDSLLIGLRNPLFTAGRAIIFELKNPAEVIDKKQSPVFGHTMLWDLKGRGIRGMEYSGYHKQYFILAGAIDDETSPALYHWDGNFNSAPVMLYQWPPSTPSFTPEGIATAPDTGRLWIFSDDGSVEVKVGSASECMEGELLANGRCLNKHLKNNAQRTYRVEQIDPAELKRKF